MVPDAGIGANRSRRLWKWRNVSSTKLGNTLLLSTSVSVQWTNPTEGTLRHNALFAGRVGELNFHEPNLYHDPKTAEH
jgi:hypothetical protein